MKTQGNAAGMTQSVGNCRSQFTLIELLIAITIIAILASMLLPALGQARDKALSIKCQNNFRQVGQAVQMYALQNNDYTPYDSTGWWYRLLDPLLDYTPMNGAPGGGPKDKPLYWCPKVYRQGTQSHVAFVDQIYLGYYYGDVFFRMNRVRNSSVKFMLTENSAKNTGARSSVLRYYYTVDPGYNYAVFPHKSRMTIVFFDGHVEQLPFLAPYFAASNTVGNWAVCRPHWDVFYKP